MTGHVFEAETAEGVDLKSREIVEALPSTSSASTLLSTWMKECDCTIRLVVLRITTALYCFYSGFSIINGHYASAVVYGICLVCSFAALQLLTGPRADSELKSVECKLAIIAFLFPVSLRIIVANAADGPHYIAWETIQEVSPMTVAGLIRHSRLLSLFTFCIPIFVTGLRFKVYRCVPLLVVVGDAAMSIAMHAAVIHATPDGETVSKEKMMLSTLVLQVVPSLLAIVSMRKLDTMGTSLARIGEAVDAMVRDSIQEKGLALSTKHVEFLIAPEGRTCSDETARSCSDCVMESSEKCMSIPDTPMEVDQALNRQITSNSKSSEGSEAPNITADNIGALEGAREHGEEDKQSGLQKKVSELVHSGPFTLSVSAVLTFNMVVLALHADYGQAFEGSPKLHNPFYIGDIFFAIVYTVEIALRIFSCRCRFFKVPFNVFELFLVVAGNIDFVMDKGLNPILMRSLRMLRLTRMVKLGRQFRELRVIMEAILRSFRVVAWSGGLLFLIIFSSAIFVTQAIGRSDWIQRLEPEEARRMQDLFDTVPKSMYTLLQIATLESWSEGIVRPTMRHEPLLLIFFVPYVMGMTICVFNVVAAVIVDSTSSSNAHSAELEKVEQMRLSRDNLVDELKEQFSRTLEDPETITRHEWRHALAHTNALVTVEEVGLTPEQTLDMFDALDSNGSARVNVDRFVRCLSRGVESLKHIDVTCLQANMSTAHKSLKEDLVEDLSRMFAEQEARLEARLAGKTASAGYVASQPPSEPGSKHVAIAAC
jgi:voltage-gated sodium channel